jgi:hypothetical protein
MDKINLSNQAILVELNVRMPSFRKLDRKVSKEVTASKGANDTAARVNKNLLAGTDKLNEIQKFVSSVRVDFYYKTLPWSDSGQRLVDIRNFVSLKDWLNDKRDEFNRIVGDFLVIYPNLVSAQAFAMGAMFDRSEYPDVNEVMTRFGFGFCFTPLPERGDFRVDVGHDIASELQKEYELVYETRTAQAMEDLWARVYKTVKHISDRFADTDEGKRKVLHETVLTNALELCELLQVMNVTNDPLLDQTRRELEDSLMGVGIDDVKESDGLRKELKRKVDDLADRLGW